MYCRTRIHPRPDLTNPCAHRLSPVQVPIAVTRPPSPFREMEPPASAVSQPPGNSPEPKRPCKDWAAPETSGGYKTRSGRTVKPPDQLIEHFNERYCFPLEKVCFSWRGRAGTSEGRVISESDHQKGRAIPLCNVALNSSYRLSFSFRLLWLNLVIYYRY